MRGTFCSTRPGSSRRPEEEGSPHRRAPAATVRTGSGGASARRRPWGVSTNPVHGVTKRVARPGSSGKRGHDIEVGDGAGGSSFFASCPRGDEPIRERDQGLSSWDITLPGPGRHEGVRGPGLDDDGRDGSQPEIRQENPRGVPPPRWRPAQEARPIARGREVRRRGHDEDAEPRAAFRVRGGGDRHGVAESRWPSARRQEEPRTWASDATTTRCRSPRGAREIPGGEVPDPTEASASRGAESSSPEEKGGARGPPEAVRSR